MVCLDVPYPPDYGGAMEMFYTIRALHAAGIHIHLHCYEYGRGDQPELLKYCKTVHYYKRNQGHRGLSLKLPYIVCSRNNNELEERLIQDQYPVLLQGIHCTFLLYNKKLTNRKVVVRLHNMESDYYHQLAACEDQFLRKLYMRIESFLLKTYEKKIAGDALFLTITQNDERAFRHAHPHSQVAFLPAFVPSQLVTSNEGVGNFCLYHGNLSVAENEKMALWLLQKVFSKINIPFVVAGKNPSKKLEQIAHSKQHTCIVANPGKSEMDDLIAKAQINLVPSFVKSGIKFKLLHALLQGRHCIGNNTAVEGSGLEAACHLATSAEGFQALVTQLFRQPFAEEEIRLRNQLINASFNNERNVKRLIEWLY